MTPARFIITTSAGHELCGVVWGIGGPLSGESALYRLQLDQRNADQCKPLLRVCEPVRGYCLLFPHWSVASDGEHINADLRGATIALVQTAPDRCHGCAIALGIRERVTVDVVDGVKRAWCSRCRVGGLEVRT